MHRVARRALPILTLLAVVWGAMAFGAVYPWAYYPLAAMCAVVGVLALVTFRPSRVPLGALAGGLAVIALLIAIQLVPLSRAFLTRVSPGTVAYLQSYDLSYGLAAIEEPPDGIPLPAQHRPVSIDADETRTALALFVCFALFLLGVTALISAIGSPSLVRSIVMFGLLLAVFGIVQHAVSGGETDRLKLYGFWTPQFRAAPFGPFINRNHFAGWVLMALPLAVGSTLALASSFRGGGVREFLAWLSRGRDAAQMQLTALAAAVMALSMIIANSRSGLASLAAAAILAMRLAVRRQPTRGRQIVVLALAAGIVVAFGAWAGLDRTARHLSDVSNDGSMEGRIQTWSDAVAIARDFPIFGSGLGTFGVAMVKYQRSSRLFHFEEAHNDYLQVLSEGGSLLALAVLITLCIFIKGVVDRFREAPHEGTTYWTRVGAVIGLLAIGVQSLFDFSLQMPGNAAMFCVLAAIALHRSPNVRTTNSQKDVNYGYPSNP